MNSANPLDNPLSKLRDIHLPEPISAWPPAPGWWILTILLITMTVWLSWKLWKKYQQKHLYRISNHSISQLQLEYTEHQDSHLLIRQYSSLLRRIALAQYPRQQVASLTGTSWLEFLDKSASTNLFNAELGQLLINGPYQKPDNNFSLLEELTEAIQLWIKAATSYPLSKANPSEPKTDSEENQG